MRLVGIPLLPEGHHWLRVAARDWDDPLDPTYAQRLGGRWNPPDSWPTLYLNRTVEAARAQIIRLLRGTPFTPDDLTDDAFDLLSAVLPPAQVADCLSDEGLAAAGLPSTYPLDGSGRIVDHGTCQHAGRLAHGSGLNGVEARSAVDPALGRESSELAWWGQGAQARQVGPRVPYGEWRSRVAAGDRGLAPDPGAARTSASQL